MQSDAVQLGKLTMRSGNNCRIHENIFKGDDLHTRAGGVRLHGWGHMVYNNYFEKIGRCAIELGSGTGTGSGAAYYVADSCIVAFNTCFACEYSIGFISESSGLIFPIDCVIHNNISRKTKNDNLEYTADETHIYVSAAWTSDDTFREQFAMLDIAGNYMYTNGSVLQSSAQLMPSGLETWWTDFSAANYYEIPSYNTYAAQPGVGSPSIQFHTSSAFVFDTAAQSFYDPTNGFNLTNWSVLVPADIRGINRTGALDIGALELHFN